MLYILHPMLFGLQKNTRSWEKTKIIYEIDEALTSNKKEVVSLVVTFGIGLLVTELHDLKSYLNKS